jgi:hypothetical protein
MYSWWDFGADSYVVSGVYPSNEKKLIEFLYPHTEHK